MISLRQRIQNLIGKGRAKEALQQLLEIQHLSKEIKNEIISLNARFEQLISDGKIKGILTQEEVVIRSNRINEGILAIIEKLPDEDALFKQKLILIGQKLEISEKEVEKIYNYLEERYNERLDQKLDNRLALSLKLTYTQEGTTKKFVETFFSEESKSTITIENTCLDLLKLHRHLLIIGAPGSGKTTLLLDLALNWLRQSEQLSFPIIFNLASWQLENTSVEEWLENSLVHGYGFSNKFANKTLKENLILPLLDGLDEVGKAAGSNAIKQQTRIHFLTALDEFVSNKNVQQFIICSRRNEYKEIVKNAPIRAEILVNPITMEQLDNNLIEKLEKDLSIKEFNLLSKLKSINRERNSELLSILCTPFYFNIAFESDVLSHSSTDLKDLSTTQVAISNSLVQEFVNKKLTNNFKFSTNKSVHYLSWLAIWLQNRNAVTFELSDFQPSDLTRKKLMFFIGSLLFGLCFGLIYGLWIGLSTNFIEGLTIYMIYALFIGIIGFVGSKNKIQTEDIMRFKWDKLLMNSTWEKIIIHTLKTGFVVCFVFGMVIGYPVVIYFSSELDGFLSRITSIDIVFFSLVFGFLLGFWESLIKNASIISHFEILKTPYYRLKKGIYFRITPLIIVFSLYAVPALFTGELLSISELLIALYVGGIVFSLIFPYMLFDSPLAKHFILRVGLFFEKKMPLRYVKFLNHATDARILERDGGQWRFRHQILQDYFANLKKGDIK